ncbi:MAG TPA: hypothetical protein VG125_03410, partial [Pirellulales bacterium]|nr:hypothetical protein [Pirellulales bacterium]
MPLLSIGGVPVNVPDVLPIKVQSACPAVPSGSVPFNYVPDSADPQHGGNGATWDGAGGLQITFTGGSFFLSGVPCAPPGPYGMNVSVQQPDPMIPALNRLSGGVTVTVSAACCGLAPFGSTGISYDFTWQDWPDYYPVCNCQCSCQKGGPGGDQPGDPIGWPFPESPVEIPDWAANPIRYSTGEVVHRMTDLASGGFGIPWGHTRSFAGGLGFDRDVGQGYNWQVAQWPQLMLQSDESVGVFGQAQRVLWFDWNGSTTWTPR